jgi:hypothetical protein
MHNQIVPFSIRGFFFNESDIFLFTIECMIYIEVFLFNHNLLGKDSHVPLLLSKMQACQ